MLLETIERETGANPQWAVIWLHGLGADGNDFAPIVPELVRKHWPAIRFVFPHAPVRAVTINGGARMRAWYDIVGMDLASRADTAGVAESIEQVNALIEREAARGIPAERIIVAGFSQGGAVALSLGLRRSQPLAGLTRWCRWAWVNRAWQPCACSVSQYRAIVTRWRTRSAARKSPTWPTGSSSACSRRDVGAVTPGPGLGTMGHHAQVELVTA